MLRKGLAFVIWLPVVAVLALVALQGGWWTAAAAFLAAPWVIVGVAAHRSVRRLEREGPPEREATRAEQLRLDAGITRFGRRVAIGSTALAVLGTIFLVTYIALLKAD